MIPNYDWAAQLAKELEIFKQSLADLSDQTAAKVAAVSKETAAEVAKVSDSTAKDLAWEVERPKWVRAQLAEIWKKDNTGRMHFDDGMRKRLDAVAKCIEQGTYGKAEELLRPIVADVKKLEDARGEEDAHGNVRAIAAKEDSVVKAAIGKVPPQALKFQKDKFGARMASVSGIKNLDWGKMIGLGEESNAFDVISQIGVFDKGDLAASKGLDKAQKISYLTFQDSMYDDETGSREKLVKALLPHKLRELQGSPGQVKAVELAVQEMTAAAKAIPKGAGPGSDEVKKWKKAVNEAFKAIGMKGVSEEVSAVRNNIKNKIFFPKDVAIEKTSEGSPDYNVEAAILGRGRVPRTNSDPVIGFASKAMAELAKTAQGKPKSKELGVLAEKVKQLRTELDDVQREMLGLAKLTKKQRAELGAAELKKLDDKLAELKKKEDKVVGSLTSTSAAALKIMKEVGPQIGLSEEGKETGGGIGADDGSGDRDDVVKPDPTRPLFMGKNVNVRDEQTAASAIFNELGIPYTGGASGSTVDAVGGIVDTMLITTGGDANAALEEGTVKLGAEAEICMYIMGMHTAGHHSLVEMLYAAKQYPQKFFSQLRDPITDWIKWQEDCSNFLLEHENLEASVFKTLDDKGKFDQKASSAKRHAAMMAKLPEKGRVISHDECITRFMAHCEEVLKDVKAT